MKLKQLLRRRWALPALCYLVALAVWIVLGAAALAGEPIKIKVREAGDEPVQKKNTAVDELIGRAKAFDIQVKEL